MFVLVIYHVHALMNALPNTFQVMKGLRLSSDALLTIQPSLIAEPLYHVTVDIITRGLSGSILYMSSQNSTVEIALLQSYLAVVVQTEDGVITGSLYDKQISDYKLHTVTVTLNDNR